MEEEEEEYQYEPIYRTDGHWYHNAFTILGKFVNKLKATIVCDERKLPSDLEKTLTEQANKSLKEYIPMNEKIRLIHEFNTFINLQLREQLLKYEIPYDETNIYLNVVNLAKAKGINLLDPKIVRDEVLPWLGNTDWGATSGGQSKQLHNINKIIKLPQDGGIYYKKFKKSRKNQKKIYKKKLVSRKRKQYW